MRTKESKKLYEHIGIETKESKKNYLDSVNNTIENYFTENKIRKKQQQKLLKEIIDYILINGEVMKLELRDVAILTLNEHLI